MPKIIEVRRGVVVQFAAYKSVPPLSRQLVCLCFCSRSVYQCCSD